MLAEQIKSPGLGVHGIMVATDSGTFSPIISTQSAGKKPTWKKAKGQEH